MDETGFSTVPSKVGKVISLKGMKHVGQMASQERGSMVTMALAVSASGVMIPPFFLFPRKNMQEAFMIGASPGSVGYANESGWMQQTEFVKFMTHFIKYSRSSKNSPTLLLLDNHASHLSVEAIDLAMENGITLLSFPPHCSHRMHPLDVSVYGPLKTYYKSQCNTWLKNNTGKILDIRNIVGLVAKTLDLAVTQKNIKAGFKSTGICPFDPDVFNDDDFMQAVLSGQNTQASSAENQLGEEDQRRICVNSVELEVAAYESVSTSEPSTSGLLSTTSRTDSLVSMLSGIGPMQHATPQKKSNRRRKPMHQ